MIIRDTEQFVMAGARCSIAWLHYTRVCEIFFVNNYLKIIIKILRNGHFDDDNDCW